jgi:hypothetical protein
MLFKDLRYEERNSRHFSKPVSGYPLQAVIASLRSNLRNARLSTSIRAIRETLFCEISNYESLIVILQQ